MFKNYCKTAWRNLVKNKFYSFINIAGLTLGLTVGILILLWVQDEYNEWLQDFAYKINPGWGVFVIAGLIAIIIALITISIQSIKAAVANPVKSLRTE